MVKTVTYNPKYLSDFIRLNVEWIEAYFKVEQSDLNTFEHVDDYIIRRGGQIFLAVDESGEDSLSSAHVIGCCALIPHPEKGCHELAKMAVSPDAQGRGVGYMLGKALLDYARCHGARRIYLEGNTRLKSSIALYRKLGFREIPLQGNIYERCDILMELCM